MIFKLTRDIRFFILVIIIFMIVTDNLAQNSHLSNTNLFLYNVPNQINLPFSFLEKFKFDRSLRLVYGIWFAILFFILSMLFILPFILLNRNKLEKKTVNDQYLKEKFQEHLITYLFNQEGEKEPVKNKIESIAGNDYNKQFLINEIIDLSLNLKGETADRLRELYLDLRLDKLTFAKAKSKKWHLKIKAFRELAFMGLKQANEEIIKSIDSKNDILRMEAQIALVRLNEGDPFRFLNYLDKPFTLWEQMNIYELMIIHNLPVPDFVKWVNSSNKSVAIFALNMIRVFRQTNAFANIVGMLDNDDENIRKAVIDTLGSFRKKEVLDPLKDHFKNETYDNKINILKALQKSTHGSNIPFLKWVLENEHDVFIQVDAAKAIQSIGKEGEEELERLIRSEEYRNYLIILRHVLDKRI